MANMVNNMETVEINNGNASNEGGVNSLFFFKESATLDTPPLNAQLLPTQQSSESAMSLSMTLNQTNIAPAAQECAIFDSGCSCHVIGAPFCHLITSKLKVLLMEKLLLLLQVHCQKMKGKQDRQTQAESKRLRERLLFIVKVVKCQHQVTQDDISNNDIITWSAELTCCHLPSIHGG